MNLKRLTALLLAICLLGGCLLLPGCKKKKKPAPASSGAAEASSSVGRQSVQAGETAPDFTVTLVNGSTVSLSDCAGKVLLLYFFSESEAESVRGMEAVQKLATAFFWEDVVVLPIDLYDSAARCKELLGNNSFTAKIGLDALDDGSVFKSFRVQYLPATILVDREGIIRDVLFGITDEESYINHYSDQIGKYLEAAQ